MAFTLAWLRMLSFSDCRMARLLISELLVRQLLSSNGGSGFDGHGIRASQTSDPFPRFRLRSFPLLYELRKSWLSTQPLKCLRENFCSWDNSVCIGTALILRARNGRQDAAKPGSSQIGRASCRERV